MLPNVNSALHFFGYVITFWLVWRILDWIFGFIKGDTVCDQCSSKEGQIERLKRGTSTGEKEGQILRLREELELLRHSVRATDAVNFLNKANKRQLKAVHGIGDVKAKMILDRRPFIDYDEARRKLNTKIMRAVEREVCRSPGKVWKRW